MCECYENCVEAPLKLSLLPSEFDFSVPCDEKETKRDIEKQRERQRDTETETDL